MVSPDWEIATTNVADRARIAVAELAGKLNLARQPGPVLDGVLRHQAGMVGGAAGHDEDFVDTAQVLLGQAGLIHHQLAGRAHPAAQGVRHRSRLLGDLLEHEVVVAILLGGGGVPIDVKVLADRLGAIEVGDLDRLRGDQDDLVLTELDGLTGVGDEGRHVTGQEVLALATAHDQGRVAPRADHHARRVGIDGEQCKGALEPAADPAHGLGQELTGVAFPGFGAHRVEFPFEQVGRALGVGVAGELNAAPFQLRPEPGEVLEDAVVDHGQASAGRAMRMGVAVRWPTVGRPPGMPDARRAAVDATVG